MTDTNTNISLLSWLFGFGGRLDKNGYRLRWGFGFVVIVTLLLISLIRTDSSVVNGVVGVTWVVGLLFFLLNYLSSHVKRLHDFDKSGWWMLFAFIPIAALVLAVALWSGQGNGLTPNNYGYRRLWRAGWPY